MSSERRLYVRVRPTVDAPLRVEWIRDVTFGLEVYDVSVGGLGFLRSGSLESVAVLQKLPLRITVGDQAPIDVTCEVRHVGTDRHLVVGVAFGPLSDDDTKRIRRYASELLMRGM